MAFVPNVLVCDGDSITVGFNTWAGYPGVIIPQQLTRVYNVAVSGETLATMLANAPTNVDPKRASGAHDSVIVWGGTNDITSGATVAATYSSLVSYVAARFAAGWPQVFVMTTIARSDGNNAKYDQYNTLIRANAFGATAIIDIAANPNFNPSLNAQTNTQYYEADGIHPCQFGHNTVIAPLVLSVLNSFNTPPNYDTNPQFTDDFSSYFTPGTGNFPPADNFNIHTANPLWVLNNSGPGAVIGTDGGFTGGTNSFASYQGFSPTADQWIRVIVGTPSARSGPAGRLAASAATGYLVRNEATTGQVSLTKCVAGAFTTLGSAFSLTVVTGDELVLTCVGTTITVYLNGTQIIQATDSAIASGFGGVFTGASATPGNAQNIPGGRSFAVDNYPPRGASPIITPNGGTFVGSQSVTLSTSVVAGTIHYTTDGSTPTTASPTYSTALTVNSAQTIKAIVAGTNYTNSSVSSATFSPGAYSVPDDRNYSVFPNSSRSVQGTLTYDVPAHPSVTPPTDSRVAGAPVDSRAAANIPENSRTPQ